DAVVLADDPRGLLGPLERGGDDHVPVRRGQLVEGGVRLGDAGRVQRDVRGSLEEVLQVEIRLPMADETEQGHGGISSLSGRRGIDVNEATVRTGARAPCRPHSWSGAPRGPRELERRVRALASVI